MTNLERPAPPPTIESIAALIDNLDELRQLDGSQEGLAEGPYNQASTTSEPSPRPASSAGRTSAGEPGYSRKLDRDGDGVGCE